MQSSAMMALRALVLVVCLVAVPLFAIFGKDAPQVVRALIQNIAGAAARSGPANNVHLNDPPVFRPAAVTAPVISGAAQSDAVAAGSLAPLADHHGVHAGGASDPFQLSKDNPHAVRPAAGAIESPASSTAAASHAQQPSSSRNAAASPPAARLQSLPSAKSSFPPDYFRAAEERLRELGATYYLLEALGPSGDYRFYCKVAASDKPQQVFAFFATDHDPLEAINSVVRQVEGWRNHWAQ